MKANTQAPGAPVAKKRKKPSAKPTVPRKALVVGIGAYSWTNPLANPTNDSADMAKKLAEMGFEVTHLLNCDTEQMDEAVEAFTSSLEEGEIGFFYFAGHGCQYQNQNYLLTMTPYA